MVELIGRGDQVPTPNSYLSLDLVGEPLFLTRDAAGELHVFSRLCPHRGMELAEGSGQAKTLVCPYHIWSFDLAGRCKNAPFMDGNETFNPESSSLRPVRFEVWSGFIFVNLDGTAAPLAPQIQPLTDMLAEFKLEEQVTAHTDGMGRGRHRLEDDARELGRVLSPHRHAREVDWRGLPGGTGAYVAGYQELLSHLRHLVHGREGPAHPAAR